MRLIDNTIERIRPLDVRIMEKTQSRLDSLTKPQGSLGRLEEVVTQISGITGKEKPSIKKRAIIVMVADHGIVEEGVSAYPSEVTAQMVYNFISGGAAINVLAKHSNAKVFVVDMGVAQDLKIKNKNFFDKKINFGTKNFAKGAAMSFEEAIKSIEAGIEIIELLKNNFQIIGTGDMGIGNTTPGSAITSFITGMDAEQTTGRGTGIEDERLKNKISVIKKAIEANSPKYDNAIDILSKIGGFEIGGIAGLILGAAANRIPVLIDGFISGAGALIAYKLTPQIKDYIIASHLSFEQGHRIIMDYLQLKPLLNLDMRLGEGTGAALAMNIIDASLKIVYEMATFESAGVSEKK